MSTTLDQNILTVGQILIDHIFAQDGDNAIVAMMVDKAPGKGWEIYYDSDVRHTFLSKNVKNRGWNTTSDDPDWAEHLIEQAHSQLDDYTNEKLGLNVEPRGRMGGHWCLGGRNLFDVMQRLFVVELTETGKKVALYDDYDYPAEVDEILSKLARMDDDSALAECMRIVKPKQAFLDLEKYWEELIEWCETYSEFEDQMGAEDYFKESHNPLPYGQRWF